MSSDSEQSLLEEALRGDLPPADTQARVRRRLLAAGIAVGNGMAATTAAAAGGSQGVGSGLVGKALAMSWGVKLGALAVVAIPTVGLLVDGGPSAPALSAPAPLKRLPATLDGAPSRAAERAAAPALAPLPEANADSALERAPELSAVRGAPARRAAAPEREPLTKPLEREPALPVLPSQREFAGAEPAGGAASTLAEETRILDAAFAELAAGHTEQAGALIQEHERRFPSGLLKQERQRARLRLAQISRGE